MGKWLVKFTDLDEMDRLLWLEIKFIGDWKPLNHFSHKNEYSEVVILIIRQDRLKKE